MLVLSLVLIYYAIALIIFLGLFAGIIIGHLAEEELEPGFAYILALKWVLFAVIMMLFFYLNPNFSVAVAIAAIIFSLSKKRESLYYFLMAAVLFLAIIGTGASFMASLMFLYSIAVGSIYLAENKKKKKVYQSLLLQHSSFLALVAVLGLLGLIL